MTPHNLITCFECDRQFLAEYAVGGCGPAACFEVSFVYLRTFVKDMGVERVTGLVRLDRAAAAKGGTLNERLAACPSPIGYCILCSMSRAARALNDEEFARHDNSDAAVKARLARKG